MGVMGVVRVFRPVAWNYEIYWVLRSLAVQGVHYRDAMAAISALSIIGNFSNDKKYCERNAHSFTTELLTF